MLEKFLLQIELCFRLWQSLPFIRFLYPLATMTNALPRGKDKKLDLSRISAAYALVGEGGVGICIRVLVDGAWMTITPFDLALDVELRQALGDAYTTQTIQYLVDFHEQNSAKIEALKRMFDPRHTLGLKG